MKKIIMFILLTLFLANPLFAKYQGIVLDVQYQEDNIFEVTINPDWEGDWDEYQEYNILYFLDGNFVYQYKTKGLPFSFQRNL